MNKAIRGGNGLFFVLVAVIETSIPVSLLVCATIPVNVNYNARYRVIEYSFFVINCYSLF